MIRVETLGEAAVPSVILSLFYLYNKNGYGKAWEVTQTARATLYCPRHEGPACFFGVIFREKKALFSI